MIKNNNTWNLYSSLIFRRKKNEFIFLITLDEKIIGFTFIIFFLFFYVKL